MTNENTREFIRQRAEDDLEFFIRLIAPQRVLGSIHERIIKWWTRKDSKSHQILLLPRGHQKSALIAYRVAWEITCNPAIKILYISSTANLAVKQLKFIKDILTSDIYRRYWPEMVNVQDALREKWTETEISVDHPKRKEEAVRDPTIFTAGMTTTITGMHSNVTVLDDVVVLENAFTEDGRDKVEQQYSLLASIGEGQYREWVVGTRYHPNDLYKRLSELQYDTFDASGTLIETNHLFEKFEEKVENSFGGDGSGEYIWPRQQRYDGQWFGFDASLLSKISSQYLDRTQFRAQYYNDPNDYKEAGIKREYFQYYDKSHLHRREGKWFFKDARLNVFASVDFAFSLAKKADYTAIVVVGVDSMNNYYILDIARFKTQEIGTYFDHILRLHEKWDFRKIRAEVNAAQITIVTDLKQNYIPQYGLSLAVEEYRPTRNEGAKAERIYAILQPRYQNRQIWHYRGGNCEILEEELLMSKPPHDDVKDALASCIASAITPTRSRYGSTRSIHAMRDFVHTRFGGIV